MKKRLLSIALCICMALTLLPTSALAADKIQLTTALDFTSMETTDTMEEYGYAWDADTSPLTLNGDDVALKVIDGDLDLRNASTSNDLDNNGYTWDAENNALVLKDMSVNGNIFLPDADCTVSIIGVVNVGHLYCGEYGVGSGAMTITGGKFLGNIATQGSLTLNNATMQGNIYNSAVGEYKNTVLTLNNSTLSTQIFSWMPNGGIRLNNSTLTVPTGEYSTFWTEKILMDDSSVIGMGCELLNSNHVADGLDGIKQYLPNGYTVGVHTRPHSSSDYCNTILDVSGNIAAGIVIKKQPAPTIPDNGSNTPEDCVVNYTLTFKVNGGSAISELSNVAETTIDLSAYKSTRDGYTFMGWYSDSTLTTAVTSVKLTKSMTVYAKWRAKNSFTDVADDAYYEDAVDWAEENGVTSGMTETTFNPNGICTRAQTVTFLWRANGSTEPTMTSNPFTDVKSDAYYYKAVLWAVENGITVGTSATTFSPNAVCSRSQVVTFLWRAEGKPAVTMANPFTDVNIDNYYYSAVLWAVNESITTGTTATTFSPAADCSRAQIVTFLYRYLGK